MSRAPALFLSHGSPMFAVEPGLLGPNLRDLGASLRDVAAVAIVSPHWQTRGVRVGTGTDLETIHDFGGFPAALYQLRYPASGAPAFAAQAARLLADAGFEVAVDPGRGLDHGAWVPLRHLFPDAGIPVFPVSMPHDLDTAGALALGRALAPLRDAGVLVVGSGSLTHNLYEFRRPAPDAAYAQRFADWAFAAVDARDHAALVDYLASAPDAARAHPTPEHYLPLVVAAGASDPAESVRRIEGGITDGVLSMDSFGFGLDEASAAQARAA